MNETNDVKKVRGKGMDGIGSEYDRTGMGVYLGPSSHFPKGWET